MDPDPDSNPGPDIFVIDLQEANKKLFKKKLFCLLPTFEGHLHHFSKIKSQNEVSKQYVEGFSYYFCSMIEESVSESEFIPLANGPGSRRPKTNGSDGFGSGFATLPLYAYVFKSQELPILCTKVELQMSTNSAIYVVEVSTNGQCFLAGRYCLIDRLELACFLLLVVP
jgi:hypothetical protein